MSCGHQRYIGRIDSNGGSSSVSCSSSSQRPQQIPFLESVVVVDVSCGEGFTIALTDCGVVFAWGNNTDDRLGLDTSVSFNICLFASFMKSGRAQAIKN